MGAIAEHAAAFDDARLGVRLVIVCGRNARLKETLEARDWSGETEVHGFVSNLHEMMAAADVLVSKSGPGSIMEGCVAGLPILLYDYLPGQELGNVQLVEERGIGHYERRPANLVARLRTWIEEPQTRLAAADRAYPSIPMFVCWMPCPGKT